MLTVDKLVDFKIERRRLQLPKPVNNKGNLIFLPYMTPKQCGSTIKRSTLFARMSYWKNIFREYRYAFKLYNKMIRHNNMRERNAILDQYMDDDKSLKGIKNITIVKNKNCYIDLSQYMSDFFNFHRKSWKITVTSFINMLVDIINDAKFADFDRKFILLNIDNWDTDKKTVINKYNILSNPFSILYLSLRKDFTLVQKLGNIDIFITNGTSAFFKFNPLTVDKNSYLDFKLCLSKIKENLLEKELDNDIHLETYGTTSSNAPKEELEKAKLELHGAEQKSNGDDEIEMTLVDQIDQMTGDINTDETSDDDDEETDTQPADTEDEENPGSDSEDTKESEEDKQDRMEKELLAELDTDEDTAEEVQKVIAKKVPDRPMSAREAELKRKQMEIKLSSGKTLSEILDQAKNNPSLKKIETYDVSTKVNTLNKSVTNIKLPNFEKSYNEQVFEHDFYGIFNGLSEKKDLPVYIRKITKEDTSDSLNQKETYTIEMEDDVYHKRHTFTIDVPKFVENKFMYLSGNKKMFVKQLILKPVVKIAPDTVQVCSNYSKIFMYRYGDNVSPKMQNVIKVLMSNTKYFNVKAGNSVPLNKAYKTTIEYDSIAKSIITLQIKRSKITLFFSQEHLDKYIKAHGYEKYVADIDRNTYLIFGIDESNTKPEFLTVLSDEAATAAVDFNNGEDIDPDTDDTPESVIDTILALTAKYNPDFDASAIIGDAGIKVSKRYIYSHCKIMKKLIPTIFLLSYTEGLTTVMRKANINYTFQAARPKFDNNIQKLDKGVIQFADGYLVFDRYPIQNSLLMNAFTMLDTKAYDFEDMDRPDVFMDIFGLLYGNRRLASAFDSFYDNMIDPITKEILDSMNYPTEFVPLLLFANSLLCDNNFSSEIDMNNFRVRSNEMVNAMLYKIVANAYSNYKRTAMNRTPMTISVPRNALIKELVTSQSVEDYSTLNPILESEKSRAITCKGPSGINLDQSYTEEKRCFDKSMTGLMAMSTSPDGNCGVVRELTVDPKIVSPRGFIDTNIDINSMSEANLFNTSEMAIPGAGRSDDSIRTSMMYKQN